MVPAILTTEDNDLMFYDNDLPYVPIRRLPIACYNAINLRLIVSPGSWRLHTTGIGVLSVLAVLMHTGMLDQWVVIYSPAIRNSFDVT